MFTKYFRNYPWGLQLVLLMMLVLTLASFITLVQIILLPKITGVSVTDIAAIQKGSSRNVINTALWSQFFTHVAAFSIPALLFAYWTHPRPKQYLGLVPIRKKTQPVLVVLLMISAMPLILYLEHVMRSNLHFPARFMEMQKQNDLLIETFLNIQSLGQFLVALLVLAIAPAFGEELLFRSLFMRFAAKTHWGIVFAIVISSLLFMLMHPNPLGYVPIFLAGVLLGFIYYCTGSVWMSMLAHFVNNGLQVGLMYYANSDASLKNFLQANEVPGSYALLSTTLIVLFIWLLWRNKTPLEKNWYKDFETGEITAPVKSTDEND